MSVQDWIIQRVFALVMLIILGILIVVSILLISMGGRVLKYLVVSEILTNGSFVFILFSILRWVIGIFALCFAVSLLYYFGNVRFDEHYRKEYRRPRRNGKKYREFVIFSPGSILATTLFVLGTVGFNTYISNFSRYNVLYGSIGTLIILMLWIWVVSILILAGNDLNSGIRRASLKLSAGEDNSRRKQIVIEALSKSIHTHEAAIENRKKKITHLQKEIDDRQIIIDRLEEDNKDSELIITAYRNYVERELKSADQDSVDVRLAQELKKEAEQA